MSRPREVSYHVKKLRVPMQLPDYGVVPFIGATSSGKTKLMIDIMYHIRKRFDRVIAIVGSKDTEREFGEHISDLYIWDKFDPDHIRQIYEQQERNVFRGVSKPLLVILDDFMYASKALQKGDILNKIFMNGRHAQILFFVSIQYCKSLPPALRQQARMIFMMAERNPANRLKLFDAFNTCFQSKEEFDTMMLTLTKNYQAMVLSNMGGGSADLVDNVFWYKAALGHKFKMGDGGLMWKIHHRKYDPKYFLRNDEEEDESERPVLGRKTGKSVMKVYQEKPKSKRR
jgi:hypothetical protein